MVTSGATITLIVPALNEEAVIASVLDGIYAEAARHFRDFELLAVDDGSTDSTGAIMEQCAARNPKMQVLHNQPNIGLGASFQKGLKQARFQYVMLLCGDGGLPARSLPETLKNLQRRLCKILWRMHAAALMAEKRSFQMDAKRASSRRFAICSG